MYKGEGVGVRVGGDSGRREVGVERKMVRWGEWVGIVIVKVLNAGKDSESVEGGKRTAGRREVFIRVIVKGGGSKKGEGVTMVV